MIDDDGRFHGAVSRAAIINEVAKSYENGSADTPQTLGQLQAAAEDQE